MVWSWFEEVFASLPGCKDDIFQRFWCRKKLQFNERPVDVIDKYSARLVCAIISQGNSLALREASVHLKDSFPSRLFLVLPDFQNHRPAFLFATGLIRYCRDSRQQLSYENSPNTQRVLYFGSTVGIREQLRQVTVGDRGKNLADLFQQQHRSKRTTVQKIQPKLKSNKFNLPEVVTIYAPVDPVSVMDQYQPQWIAIDCGDEDSLNWLLPLLQDAVDKNIPVIAWGQNPLSDCVANFSQYGLVWSWPSTRDLSLPSRPKLGQNIQSILQAGAICRLQPVVLKGRLVDSLDVYFRDAYRLLVQSAQSSTGRLAKDTLRLHWQYLRTLELLSVPLNIYEAEAPNYWGIKSFDQLANECKRFREACCYSYPDIVSPLEEVSAKIEECLVTLKISDIPLWNALCNLCIEEPTLENARFIIFTSRARKQLFLLALLARYNIVEEDLRQVRTWIFTLDELRQLMRKPYLALGFDEILSPLSADRTLGWHSLFVGLPSSWVMPKLQPLLLQETASVLIYAHQSSALARQVKEWAQRLNPDISRVTAILSSLSGLPTPQDLPDIASRVELADLIELDAESGTKTKDLGVKPLWQPTDPVSEVARLLQSDEGLAEDELILTDPFQGEGTKTTGQERESWCESAVEVDFEQGWHACFAADDTINLIVNGSTGQHTDERYVRSLRHGDRVVAIPGQRRQSLYDLIVSRVHGHPAIEMHLALIRRWQQDFVAAYQRWRQHGVKNLEDLLGQIQKRGSALTSTFTLRQWLWGNTLCPDDAEDLRRLAEVLDMGFVCSYYRKIDKAAQRLRSLHRGLSRRLNTWLEQQFTGAVGRSDQDLIDPELGLTFSHFRSSLLILRVTAVRPVTGLFLRSSLGKFERDIQQ